MHRRIRNIRVALKDGGPPGHEYHVAWTDHFRVTVTVAQDSTASATVLKATEPIMGFNGLQDIKTEKTTFE